jgi:hypothetical protein
MQRVNIYVLGQHNIPEFSRLSGIPTEILEQKYREAVAVGEHCVFELRIKQRRCRSFKIGDNENGVS